MNNFSSNVFPSTMYMIALEKMGAEDVVCSS
jgi:hypothetical protein